MKPTFLCYALPSIVISSSYIVAATGFNPQDYGKFVEAPNGKAIDGEYVILFNSEDESAPGNPLEIETWWQSIVNKTQAENSNSLQKGTLEDIYSHKTFHGCAVSDVEDEATLENMLLSNQTLWVEENRIVELGNESKVVEDSVILNRVRRRRLTSQNTVDLFGIVGFEVYGLDRIDQAFLPLDNNYTFGELTGTGVDAYVLGK